MKCSVHWVNDGALILRGSIPDPGGVGGEYLSRCAEGRIGSAGGRRATRNPPATVGEGGPEVVGLLTGRGKGGCHFPLLGASDLFCCLRVMDHI